MPDAELDPLLSPLADDAPCGADLEYDPAFLALLEAAAGKPEQQYGDTVIPAQEPDWPTVYDRAQQLAVRTRDLRVAVWLARSGARVAGLPAAVRGLQLVHGLVERHWEHVHPQLDAADHNDPTARVNALTPIIHADAGLADLRAARLNGKRGAPTVRELELALGRVEPLPGEPVPTEDGVLQGVSDVIAEAPDVAVRMQAGWDAAQGISSLLEQRLDSSQGLDFAPLKKLMQRVAQAAQRASGQRDVVTGADHAPPGVAAAAVPGAINSREDAIRALERACDWIERNEPSNPAPLLVRRAQRLMSKNFIDIIRDLVPDGLGQVEKLAGPGNS